MVALCVYKYPFIKIYKCLKTNHRWQHCMFIINIHLAHSTSKNNSGNPVWVRCITKSTGIRYPEIDEHHCTLDVCIPVPVLGINTQQLIRLSIPLFRALACYIQIYLITNSHYVCSRCFKLANLSPTITEHSEHMSLIS